MILFMAIVLAFFFCCQGALNMCRNLMPFDGAEEERSARAYIRKGPFPA